MMPSTFRSLFVMLALAGALLSSAQARAQDAAPPRPHIVHIVADDLGWKDVGFNGAEDLYTPNIDALAAAGAELTQFYAQPMCTPTRAALMTGRYPFRYGLQTAVILSVSDYGLDTEEWLMPQALKEAGYATAIIGKWRLGHADRKYWPRQRGFDYQYGPIIGERTEVVYNVEPFRGALRQGDWKLLWRTMLPKSIELFNLAEDPGETMNLAAAYPDRVRTLQRRLNDLAEEAAKPLFLIDQFKVVQQNMQGEPVLPIEDEALGYDES